MSNDLVKTAKRDEMLGQEMDRPRADLTNPAVDSHQEGRLGDTNAAGNTTQDEFYNALETVRNYLKDTNGEITQRESKLIDGINDYVPIMIEDADSKAYENSLRAVAGSINALSRALPQLTSRKTKDTLAGVLNVLAGILTVSLPQPVGIVVGAVVSLVSSIITTTGRGQIRVENDSLLQEIEKLLIKHHAQVIRLDINGLLHLFRSAQVTMNKFQQDGIGENDEYRLELKTEVPNNIGVEPLGRIAAFLKQCARTVENATEAKALLDIVNQYCGLRAYRMLLLKQKQSLLMKINTKMSREAAERVQNMIDQFELGEERQVELRFLVRPETVDEAVVTATYLPDDWNCTAPFLDIVGLERQRFIPDDHQTLRVKRWEKLYAYYSTRVYTSVKITLSAQTLTYLLPVAMVCAFPEFEDSGFFVLKWAKRATDKVFYVSLDKSKQFYATESIDDAIAVRVILTEDDVCLFAPRDVPGNFIILEPRLKPGQSVPYVTYPNLSLCDGIPGPEGHWVLKLTCKSRHRIS